MHLELRDSGEFQSIGTWKIQLNRNLAVSAHNVSCRLRHLDFHFAKGFTYGNSIGNRSRLNKDLLLLPGGDLCHVPCRPWGTTKRSKPCAIAEIS
jgi:hypothetical protein